jgi:processing peptidase subunit beta
VIFCICVVSCLQKAFKANNVRSFSSKAADTLQALSTYPSTKVTTLKNGLRVASEPSAGETATVGVYINTGSRYEDSKNNGTAHFLEHMLFKGTARRTRQNLEMEVENIGGHLNAYTSREQTVFNIKVFKNDVGQALDILSDILSNSQITPDAIERERDVILREMQEVEGQMEEVIFDRLHETAYRGTALAQTILGPSENIKNITKADIDKYVKSHYTAPRMVIAAAGNIDHSQLVAHSEKYFSQIPTNPTNGIEPVKQAARFTGSDILIRYDSMPFAHITYAFETAGWNDPDNIPLMVIQTMLDGWDSSNSAGPYSSSELVKSVSSHDLAKSIVPFNTQYSDTGLFGLYAVAPPAGQQQLAIAMGESLTGLCFNVSEEHLHEAKTKLKLSLLGQLDGSSAVCEEIGRQMLSYGRRIHPIELLNRIESVDANAIKACAKRFFYDKDYAMSAIGPLHELPDYNFWRRRTYWLRY